jgi:hypothetical protein
MRIKNLFFIILLTGVVIFLLQGCCKVYCGVKTLSVRFINYKVTDIDTVLFVKYAANGRFDQKIDSTYQFTSSNQADTIYSGLSMNVDYDKDWKIKLLSINREYNITAIQTAKKNCTCGSSTYEVISKYNLDGINYNSDIFDLKK